MLCVFINHVYAFYIFKWTLFLVERKLINLSTNIDRKKPTMLVKSKIIYESSCGSHNAYKKNMFVMK